MIDNKSQLMVSICTLTYNQAPYIRECLEGILMQKVDFQYEILINDDCSTDGTTEIIKEYESKYPQIIKPLYHKRNHFCEDGASRMFPKYCFNRAEGKYIAMCEGDDYWTDCFKLQKQVDFLENNQDYVMVYTDYDLVSGKKQTLKDPYPDGNYHPHILVRGLSIGTLTVLFRRDAYLKTPKYFLTHKWLMGDKPLWFELASIGKIKFMKDKTASYRILDQSASHSADINKLIAFKNEGVKISRFYANVFEEYKYYDFEDKSYYLGLMRYAYRTTSKTIGTQIFIQAIKARKVSVRMIVFYIGTMIPLLKKILGEH